MFTESFGAYVCSGDSISCVVDGFRIVARVHSDDCGLVPWEEDSFHGPVSDWTTRDKRAGEMVLSENRGSRLYYDFAEACRIALRDEWGVEGMIGTRRQIAAEAARRDFEYLRAWCNDEWYYCGIVMEVYRGGVCIDDHAASLWGIECNFPAVQPNGYLMEVANELLNEAVTAGHAALAQLCACKES